MAPFATYLIVFAFVVYGLVMLVELLRYKSFKKFVLQVVALAAVVVVLHVTMGFPEPDRSRAFGGGFSPLLAVGVMFVATLLGIAARYYFYMREFSWRSFLKPICITPIVLLPMMGSVHGSASIDEIQLISFGFLAFQNGFHWCVLPRDGRLGRHRLAESQPHRASAPSAYREGGAANIAPCPDRGI